MKNIAHNLIACAALIVGGLLPVATQAEESLGHHQSGVSGKVDAGGISTTTGVIPDRVRVYSDSGELLTEVETEVTETAFWHFEVYLKPGSYVLLAYSGTPPENGGILSSLPAPVTVVKKQFTEVVMSFRPI